MANKIDARISLKTDGTGKVTSDVKKVTESFKHSGMSVDAFRKKLSAINIATKITAVASAMQVVGGVVRGVSSAVGAVTGVVNSFASKADSMSKFSRNIGLSVVDLQKWHYAAERSGMSTEQFNNSIRKFSINVSKAVNGEKKQVDLFNALGVSLKRSNGEVKSNNELMLELAEAYDKISNAQDKLRVTEELFGRGATGIGNLFENGANGIKELLDRREKIGGMFTEDDAKNAEGFKDLMLDVDKIAEGIKNKFVAEMLPGLNNGLNEFLDIWDKNGDAIMKKVGEAATFAVNKFNEGVKFLGDWARIIDQVNAGLNITAKDVAFVGKELAKESAKKNLEMKLYPVAKILQFLGYGENEEVAPQQVSNPSAVTTTQNYTETRNTKTTSNVNINVNGNKNTEVDVDEAFAKDPNVDLGWVYSF